MGLRGTKNKPAAVHKANGTARDDRMLPDALENYVQEVDTIPLPPITLSDIGKKHWFIIVGQMVEGRIFTNGDRVLVESLCMKLDIQEQAYESLKGQPLVFDMVNHKGMEYKMINPLTTVINGLSGEIIKICTQLGLSPFARTQIGVGKSDPDDPLAAQLNKKKNNKI